MVKDVAIKYLNNKLNTTVRLDHLAIDFPSSVALDSLYIEDQSKDTLVYTGHLFVQIDMLELLSGNVRIDSVRLDDFSANISRTLPDTAFNFNFILRAFGVGEADTTAVDTSSSGSFFLGTINLSNIRFSYNDVLKGIHAKAALGKLLTRFNVFDLDNMRFDFDSIKLGSFKTSYLDQTGNMEGKVALDSLLLVPEKIDLNGQDIRLKKLLLNHSDIVFSMKSVPEHQDQAVASLGDKEDTASSMPWHITLQKLQFSHSHFKFDDKGQPKQQQGIDYSHLDISNFALLASDLFYSADSSYIALQQLRFNEKSGFNLKQLRTDVTYTDHGMSLDHLLLQTTNSHISKKLTISYPSLDALSESPGKIGVDVVIDSAIIGMKDVYYFQPDLAENEYLSGLSGKPVYLHTVLQGKLNNLTIDSLILKVGGTTSLAMQAHLADMLEPEKAKFDVDIRHFATGRKDLQSLLPDKLLPEAVRIPNQLSLTGNYTGSLENFVTNFKLISTDGDATISATIENLSDTMNVFYDATVALNKIRLDRILKNDTLYGAVSVEATIKGHGLTPQTMETIFNGKIEQIVLQGYNYKNIILKGYAKNQKGQLIADVNDPNLSFTLTSNADFSDSLPTVAMKLDLNKADLKALHFVQDSLKLQGQIIANIDQLDLGKPNGKIAFKNWHIIEPGQNIHIDSVLLIATSSDTLKTIQLRSPVARADIYGNYKWNETTAIMQHFKNKYLAVDSAALLGADTLSDWNMNIDFRLLKSDLWQQLLPALTQFDGANFKGIVRSKPGSIQIGGTFAPFTYNGISVDSIRLGLYTQKSTLHYSLLAHAIQNSSINIPQILVNGHLDSNAVLVNLKTNDTKEKTRYHLSGKLDIKNNNYKISLLNDSLMLNYSYWKVPTDNYVLYSSNGLTVNHLELQNGNQLISANSDTGLIGNPLHIALRDFKVTTLTQLALKDSMAVKGIINGNATIDSITGNPIFVTDLRLDSFSVSKTPVGSILLKVNNKKKNTYSVNMQLTGNGNDVKVTGAYYTKEKGSFDFDVEMKALTMKTIEAFSFDQIKNTKGKLTGNLTIQGTTELPDINGALRFNDVGLKVTQLNNYFKLKDESITFNASGIHFNKFTILDSANNKAVIDGDIFTQEYEHFRFNLSLNADNYRVMNIPKGKGEGYYGQVYISANAKISGDEHLPKIDMRVKLEDHSNLTVVMMNENPEVVSSKGVVEFFDPDAPVDSSKMLVSDSMRYSNTLTGIALSANIAIDTNALLNLVIDPVNGDNLSVKGQANLNFTIDPGGKMSLTGRYDLINGAYNMSFQGLIKKEFDILRGSYIIWKGDPTAAEMNITAQYRVEAPALNLIQDQLTDVSETTRNTYKQELPFYVLLHLEGELMHPDIHFELGMPKEAQQAFNGSVYTRIRQINTHPSEINKQALGLLVLGHFIADNPFQTAGGGGAKQLVRESASKILSQQLNRLAGNLIQGVNLNFDLESSQDYSSGSAQNETNLNIGLSKSLFNDRTTIYVGGNIPLEGNSKQKASQIVGDVAVEYKLSKDGRYRLRAYRKNKYQGVIEGQYIETGLSFIIVMNYDNFKELFHSASKQSDDE